MPNDSHKRTSRENATISAAISAYLGLAEHSYAVLIDGDWGVGKTYFVKRYLDERCGETEQQYVLVSLFGLSTVTDIRAAMLRSLGRGGKAAKIGADVLKGAGDLLGGVFAGDPNLGTQYTEKALEKLGSLGNNAIFVFDDLERMTIPQDEALGFINTLIEDQGRPVLLIANQDKIIDQEDWKLRKEKLIGKTVSLSPNAASVLNLYLESAGLSKRTKVVLSRYRDQIESSFQKSSFRNLRSLKVALQDFDQIIHAIDEDLELDDEHLAEIAQLVVILTLEVKAGSITTDQFRDFHKLRVHRVLGRDVGAESSELSEHFRITVEHIDVSFEAPALEYRFIADLLSTGAFNRQDLNEWLKASFAGDAEYEPSWRKLGFLQSQEPAEVEKIIEKVRTDLENRKITQPSALLEVAATIIDLGSNVDLIGGEDPLDYFKKYLNEIYVSEGMSLQLDSGIGETFTPLDVLSDSDRIHFNSISRLIEEFANKQKRDEAALKFENAIVAARADGLAHLQLLSDESSNNELMALPVLAETDPEDFATVVLRTVHDFQQGCRILVARYRSSNGQRLLDGESRWLEQLRQIIEAKIDGWPQPSRELQKRFLHNSFVDIRRNR
ncbi:MAG: P-loop NTPase fold protein [Pseudomonadota bacterium]